ncbi:MAG: aldehyde dehydrogenase family protein [Mesorhizobium sp.]|uniref:aldehyde dehydrogenase family protein n=2 Tax=Mesorhizobium sp. TaxID=1871066 RepID=UPI0011FA2F12|nr:aldehyde dehydrogenase family protein [Mesorhizobium sp.]TIR32339.1 MAG: aldehyde dehydrogenase family protein [Mesorhizobium sp.]TIS27783.1 MAG: aldehyde dehydrogenase family protein [Mesorhizobium sp.]
MTQRAARRFANWIGGAWRGANGPELERRDPASGAVVSLFRDSTADDVDAAVSSAMAAFKAGWSAASGAERAAVLAKAADNIRLEIEELAYFEMAESGKPARQARLEIERSAMLWDYAATQARSVTGDSFGQLGGNYFAVTVREPLGVAAIITPWNFPFLIVSQKLPFALAAGCAAVVKPSELTSATALLLGPILKDAGLPDGVLNIITGLGRSCGDALLHHPSVDMISFTGSTTVGKHAMRVGADGLKKVSLELGGKNAHIVMADADLDAALDAALHGAFLNAGQSCNQGSRLLLQSSIAEDFTRKLVDYASRISVGDTRAEGVLVGPIINKQQYDKIVRYIANGREEGATLALGGTHREEGEVRFVDPTIFTGVQRHMRIAREEIFGPVLSILSFDTIEEAVSLANDSVYGLSAGLWTANVTAAMNATRAINAGTIWINTYLDGPPELPFGGVRESGIGREVGRLGVEEFMDIKTVQIRSGGYASRWIGSAVV